MKWYQFRSWMAKLAVLSGLAISAIVFGPDLILYLGGCTGGSMGPHVCTYLPDWIGAFMTGMVIISLFSGLFFLAIVAVPILFIGGIILELAARKDTAK